MSLADPPDLHTFVNGEALQRRGRWVAYGAALWAAVFGVFHIIWAGGWYPLLNADRARMAFATPWKWAYNVVVAVICVVAVPVALVRVHYPALQAGRIAVKSPCRLDHPWTPDSRR